METTLREGLADLARLFGSRPVRQAVKLPVLKVVPKEVKVEEKRPTVDLDQVLADYGIPPLPERRSERMASRDFREISVPEPSFRVTERPTFGFE